MLSAQDQYLAELADYGMEYQQQSEVILERLVALSQERRRGADGGLVTAEHITRQHAWIQRRREHQGRLSSMQRWREERQHAAQDKLRQESLALSQEYPALQDLMLGGDFAEEGMLKSEQRAERREQEAEREREQQASSQVYPTWYAVGAYQKYISFFAKASGRSVSDGPPGVYDTVRPELPLHWRGMNNTAWAFWWLGMGGYRHAEQTDEHGWTALHHAIQATVYWDIAPRICRGLIPMMSSDWLRARTWGNRMIGYTPLHCCCNGSDLKLQRADICRLLIQYEADIEARDDCDRTPFLLACGTGLLDVAQALSHLGADVHAIADERNAADRSRSSSSSVFGWPHEMTIGFFFWHLGSVVFYAVASMFMCMLFDLPCLLMALCVIVVRWLTEKVGVHPTGTKRTGRWRAADHVSWSRQLRYDESDAMERQGNFEPRGRSLPPWRKG